MNEACLTLIDVDFDFFAIDEKFELLISSVEPNHEYGDDELYEYEFPKQIKIKFEAHAYIDQGLAADCCPHKMAQVNFSVEVPDQEIEIDYVRTNVLTDERETLTVKHNIKDIKVGCKYQSERTPFGGKFHGGLVPANFELANGIVYFQYE